MKLLLAVALVSLTSLASAHKVTTTFPDGATSLTAQELKSAIANREFTARPADGPLWHLKYRESGDFTVRAGSFSDEGKWSAKESSICTEGKKLQYLCNDFRLKDGTLFIQRKGGEVMQLIPK